MFYHKIKILCGISTILFLAVGISLVRAMIPPKTELIAYIAALQLMKNEELLAKYHTDLAALKKSDQTSSPTLEGEERIAQLPIFKLHLFNATLLELKKRKLISPKEFSKGEKLVKEKEALLHKSS